MNLPFGFLVFLIMHLIIIWLLTMQCLKIQKRSLRDLYETEIEHHLGQGEYLES